jgi:hypothetical protein
MSDRSGCAEVRELLPELALGVAAGDERARALRHLSGCVECRRELDAMSTIADELLTLVPPAEPPGGFESAVLARIAPARRRWWRRPVMRLATAGALALAVGVGGGAGVALHATADDRRVANQYRQVLRVAGGRYLAVRPLTAPDQSDAGRVFAYQGNPSWVFAVVRRARTAGRYQEPLVTRDGRDRVLGEVVVAAGEGSWGVAIDQPVAQVAEVRLESATGPVLTAVFH